ncbi:hypothetical protein [Halanaeroarchaeum sp. HSR-CO]|uniref:hypothetical protein n=1 Tax=Halanaeroarchaeum sp. HSR-CO TaxID=2866382 RepID=UPI00217D0EEA|nr:hypothetical protein [Halanaeroarchaeum sp. HSR-CO]
MSDTRMRQRYMDGKWADADTSTGFEVPSPGTSGVLDTVPAAAHVDGETAVAVGQRRRRTRGRPQVHGVTIHDEHD